MKRLLVWLLVPLLLGCGGFAVSAAEEEPHEHAFGAWYTVTEPTCTDEGEERRDCENCDAFETRAIDPCHQWSDWAETLAPTCTEAGEERRDCENCDAFETRAIDAAGHQWSEWAETLAPTCTDEGEERRDCENCDAFETNVLNARYHSFVIDPAVPVTCTTEGKTQGEHCALCGAVKTQQVTLKPLGHAVLDENGDCLLCGAHVKDLCPYCHKDHGAQPFGRLIAWFHRLFYRIRLRFQPPAS